MRPCHKNIQIMEEEKLFDRSKDLGEKVLTELQNLLRGHPYVGDVRGKGFLIGIELVKDKQTKEPLNASLVNEVIALCKKEGLLIGKNGTTVAGYNNVLVLSPPLNIPEDDIDFLIKVLTDSLEKMK